MKNNLLFIGAPGSGKGTQAAKLVKDHSYIHISTGDLLRAEVAKKSELGNRVAGVMSSGALVSDELVLELLKVNCDLAKGSYIFDGFPRNVAQANMLLLQLFSNRSDLKAVYFKIDLNILKERAVNRRFCNSCGQIYNLISKPPVKADECDSCHSKGTIIQRKDDFAEIVENRLKIFKETIDPMVELLKEKGLLVEIDANETEEKIYTSLRAHI